MCSLSLSRSWPSPCSTSLHSRRLKQKSVISFCYVCQISSSTILTEEPTIQKVGSMILEGHKMTSVAHKFWECIVQPGDTVVDATCGNGYDTLAMARIVLDERNGRVVAMDAQEMAIKNTQSLLQTNLTSNQIKRVQLIHGCHSTLKNILPAHSARLVAFNLGYLPGGSKEFVTRPESTREALEAAATVVAPGGLVSVAVYVGHEDGRREYDVVIEFARELCPKSWVCTLQEKLNRLNSPQLVLMYKK